MKNLIEKLKASGVIVMGGRADVHHNIDARKYLAEEEMAVFPDEYFSLVKYSNGLRSDKGELYAILPLDDNRNFKDAVRMNEELDREDCDTVSVLGETSYDYLVYDNSVSQYQLRDKIKDDVVFSFSSIIQAVEYMFL